MRKNRPHKSGGSFPEIGSSKAVLSSETGRNAPDIHQGVGLSCGEAELVKASSSFGNVYRLDIARTPPKYFCITRMSSFIGLRLQIIS